MAITRSQTTHVPIKEEKCKNNQLLNNVSNTPRERSKITKRTCSKNKSKSLPACEVKIEEGTDSKHLLKSQQQNHRKRSVVTEEQIKQLIDYIKNKNMTVAQASRKVKIDFYTGRKYYSRYQKDPNQDLLAPQKPKSRYTYQDIKTLIGYIVDDGMSIRQASSIANITYCAGQTYYKRYCEDPNHKIPVPDNQPNRRNRICTQDQIKNLIQYIVNDKMSIQSAAIKAKMGDHTARRYYGRYLNDPNHEIPVPNTKNYENIITQEQVNDLIDFIVNDNMSIENASTKANMSERSGGKYYRRYLDDPERNTPVLKKNSLGSCKPCTQEQVRELIGYIVDDKISLAEASAKVNMTAFTAKKYYDLYMKDPNHEIPLPNSSLGHIDKRFSQQDIEDFIGYIVDDKMSISAVAAKINMSMIVARKYYRQYLYDPDHKIPAPGKRQSRRCTNREIN